MAYGDAWKWQAYFTSATSQLQSKMICIFFFNIYWENSYGWVIKSHQIFKDNYVSVWVYLGWFTLQYAQSLEVD